MTTTTTHTVSNVTRIMKLTCSVCKQPVIVEAGMKNVTCRCCGNTMEVKLYPNMDNYVVGLGVTEGGHSTMDINDDVAAYFRGMGPEELFPAFINILETIPKGAWFSKKMKKNHDAFSGTTEEFFRAKYEHLNPGMISMNLRNIVRGAFSRRNK